MLAWAIGTALIGGELRWQAPAECPSADDVRARIDDAGGLGELEVDARVEAEGDGWSLELSISLDGIADTRVLRAEMCDALAESVVALVATRLDAPPTAEPEPAPSIAVPEPAPAPSVAEPAPAPDPKPRAPLPDVTPLEPRAAQPTGLTLAVATGVGLGSVPTLGIPAELAVGYAWRRLRLSLQGRFHPGPLRLELEGDRTMRVSLGTAGPRVCARRSWRAVEFPLCGEVAVGGSRAVLRGPARNRGGVWVEASVGAGLAWFFSSRWALTGQIAASLPFAGSAYTLDGAEAWAPSPVGGRVTVGVEFLWPIQIRSRPEKPR